MTAIDDLLAHNRDYVGSHGHRELSTIPQRHLAVLTCMDSRLDLFGALGLDLGEAHLIRNAGGLATEDAVRSLLLSQQLLETRSVMVIHHTRCGLETYDEDALGERVADAVGRATALSARRLRDVDDDVRATVRALRASPFVHDTEIRGFVFDVDDGDCARSTLERLLESLAGQLVAVRDVEAVGVQADVATRQLDAIAAALARQLLRRGEQRAPTPRPRRSARTWTLSSSAHQPPVCWKCGKTITWHTPDDLAVEVGDEHVAASAPRLFDRPPVVGDVALVLGLGRQGSALDDERRRADVAYGEGTDHDRHPYPRGSIGVRTPTARPPRPRPRRGTGPRGSGRRSPAPPWGVRRSCRSGRSRGQAHEVGRQHEAEPLDDLHRGVRSMMS